MSLCIGVAGEDFAVVASDCYSGQTPERSAELGGRVGSLPGGWISYTTLEAGMAKVAAGRLEAGGYGAHQPRALQQQIATVYGNAPAIRGRKPGPDTEGFGFETVFYVAAVTPRGPETYVLASDGQKSSTLRSGRAHVSPPPGMSEALESRYDDRVHFDYLATAPTVWTAFKRAGQVQREFREGTGYVSRHMHVCAVAPEDGRWSKWALFADSEELAEMDPDAIQEEAVRFEGCTSPEALRERERKRAAAAGGR